jgi:hypothetical protein
MQGSWSPERDAPFLAQVGPWHHRDFCRIIGDSDGVRRWNPYARKPHIHIGCSRQRRLGEPECTGPGPPTISVLLRSPCCSSHRRKLLD